MSCVNFLFSVMTARLIGARTIQYLAWHMSQWKTLLEIIGLFQSKWIGMLVKCSQLNIATYQTSKGPDNTAKVRIVQTLNIPNMSLGEAALNQTSLWYSLRGRSGCHSSMIYAFTTCGWYQFKPPNFDSPTCLRRTCSVLFHHVSPFLATSRVVEMKDFSKQSQWQRYQGAFLVFFSHPILLEHLSLTMSHNHSQDFQYVRPRPT